MIKNYFKIAFRNLWKYKGYSLINIIGLAVGMTACLLIFMYVKFELSYDKFNVNFDQIYRLNSDVRSPSDVLHWSSVSAPMGPALQNDYPEVKAVARIFGNSYLVESKNRKFQENNIIFSDPALFKIFTFPFTHGNATTALNSPFSIVLTETSAKKYFGNDDALGKTLLLDGKYPVKITGIMKDVPLYSHFSFDMVISAATIEKLKLVNMNEWGNFSNFTYLLLPKGFNARQLEAKLPGFLRNHISEDLRKKGYNYALFLEPLKEIYMDTLRGAPVNGNLSNVYIFSLIAVFILLIACINFINLTTARATERAKEVGIRKVLGAIKNQLTAQFLSESIMICLISFGFAVLLSVLSLPLFNQLAGKTISNSLFEHSYVLILLVMALIIGAIAGIYPALVLTEFKITNILKGQFSTSIKGIVLRKGLVVIQFTISIVLIVGTLVVYNQLNYMRNQSLGFKKDQMLILDFGGDSLIQSNRESIKNELRQVNGVLAVAGSATTPGNGNSIAYSEAENNRGGMSSLNLNLYDVDYDFIPEYGIKIIAGRAFRPDFGTDSTKAFILNQAAVKTLGYTSADAAIGRKFSQWGRVGSIIGVVQDFHFRSLQQNVKPLCFRINPHNISLFTLKLKGGSIPATISAIERQWRALAPQRPLSYSFLDKNFDKQYATEEQFGKLFFYFAILAILISCLGLLGLASYSTMQRTREIGIRKVLGASISGIIHMLSKEFLLLVAISAVIAFPIAWLGMHRWLKDFAYQINIDWWVFAIAGILAITIAVFTVSFQAIKAAVANPVKSLRSE